MTDQPNEGVNPPTPPLPPAGGTPPPPPPPPPAYGSSGSGSAGGASSVDIGAAFSWAINKFGSNAVILIALAAVVFVIRFVGSLVQKGILNTLTGGSCDNTIVVNGQSIVTNGPCVASFATSITASLLTAIVFGVLAWIATIGIYRAALKTTQGQTPGFDNLTTGENLGKYIAVAIVYGLLIGVGLVLCVIPGIIAAFLFQLAPFYALDKGMSVGDALKASYEAATKNFVPVLLMTIISAITALVGSFLFGILTLVALPFAALFIANVYRQLNREEIAA